MEWVWSRDVVVGVGTARENWRFAPGTGMNSVSPPERIRASGFRKDQASLMPGTEGHWVANSNRGAL